MQQEGSFGDITRSTETCKDECMLARRQNQLVFPKLQFPILCRPSREKWNLGRYWLPVQIFSHNAIPASAQERAGRTVWQLPYQN